MNNLRYLVIGAGHGGKAMAAHLAVMGYEVTLYNRSPDKIAAIETRGGIMLESESPDGPRGFGKLARVTSDIKEAIEGNDVIMVVTPSFAHGPIAREAAPYIRDGQVFILHPGRTLGALEFRKSLEDINCCADIVVAEAQTFIYASRSDGPAQARIFRNQRSCPAGSAARYRHAKSNRCHRFCLSTVHRRGQCAAYRVK